MPTSPSPNIRQEEKNRSDDIVWCVVTAAFLSAVILGGTWQWEARRAANPDTISYLDVAGKYAQGQYSEALVRVWSPLYSWILVPITKLPRESQILFAHLLQVVFVLATIAASWLLFRVEKRICRPENRAERPAAIFLFGSTVFAGLAMIPAQYLTPDVLVIPLVLAAVTRIALDTVENRGFASWLLTGMLLAVGYLAREYVAFYGALLGGTSLVFRPPGRGLRTEVRRGLTYMLGFLLVAGPWIVVLSSHYGHLMLGEAGRSNLVARLPRTPISHPLWPQLDRSGHIRNYDRGFPLTMPEHYDPVDLGEFHYHDVLVGWLRLAGSNLAAICSGYYPPDLPLYWPLGILIIAILLCVTPFHGHTSDADRMALFLLSAGALGFLSFLTVHVETRYVAPFFILLGAAVSAALCSPRKSAPAAVRFFVLAGMLFWCFPMIALVNAVRLDRQRSDTNQVLAVWMQKNGKRYAMLGPTYDLGLAAYEAHTELVASVDTIDLVPTECESIKDELLRLNVSALLATSSAGECGVWQPIEKTGWMFWRLGDSR